VLTTPRRCVKLVSTAKTAAEAQARGERVLRSLLPPGFAPLFKWAITLFPGWFTARHAATVTPWILPWWGCTRKVRSSLLTLS
jgi:hypothetical protein